MNKELNSIGINKKPSETTVVVAMSGGVDSSTVAGIMKNEGYKVIGITLNFMMMEKKLLNQNNVVQDKI
jgi:tRNA-specific 2-thiouridylase